MFCACFASNDCCFSCCSCGFVLIAMVLGKGGICSLFGGWAWFLLFTVCDSMKGGKMVGLTYLLWTETRNSFRKCALATFFTL